MTCEEALVLLSGRLDGANTPEEDAQLDAHLQQCDRCRAILEAYTAADAGLLALEEEPPAELHDRIMDAVRAEGKPVRRKRRRPAIFGLAAAAALALALGLSYLPKTPEEPAQPVTAQVNNTLADALPQDDDADVMTRDLPGDDSAVPATFGVEPQTEAAAEPLLVELGDNAAHPAVENVPELATETAYTDNACGTWRYELTAATVRSIMEEYAEWYGFRIHGDLDNAADDAACTLIIVCG